MDDGKAGKPIIAVMQYEAVMFDLDGTLADTLADIAAAGNYLLSRMSRPTLEVERYRYLAGRGAEWLVREALQTDDPVELERGLTFFRDHYHSHNHALTQPYPGIAELLDALTGRQVKLAVLSNKPHPFTQQVVREKFSNWSFDAVHGAKDDVPLKPDPAAALAITRELDVAPERWLYVGDTNVDMQTARAANLFAVGVTWGFRDEAELRDNGAQAIIHHPTELLSLL